MKLFPRQSLTAPTVGLALFLLLVVVNLIVSQRNIHRLLENEHGVVHTQSVLTTLEEILANVTEAETAERGYLITDDTDYLRSHQSAISATGHALETLRRLSRDDSQVRLRIESLEQRVRARFDELQNAIAAQQTEGFDAARRSVLTNQGPRLMNEMRTLVGEMQDQEREALAVRSTESLQSAQVTTLSDFVAALLGVFLVALAFFLFRRELAHRRRADEALRRLAAIVESSEDAIMSKSMDGMIVSWNAGAVHVYGYSAAEVIGRPVALLCPPELADEVQYQLNRVRSGVHIDHFETTRVRKDGRRIDVSLSISPIKDATGTVIGASEIARDVTRQKLLEREVLEIAAGEQQRIGQDLHDGTGQELTGLAMMAERLAGQLEERKDPEAGAAAWIVDGLVQALSHVRDLSKGLVPVELDAAGLMAALAGLAKRTSDLHCVTCCFRCDEPVGILDNQTATHLYRLSQEAVTNALKHGRARNIVISLTHDGSRVSLVITDDGLGISDATCQTSGTGLQIMHYRAELIRAKLTIGAAQPHGTQVICILPRQQDGWAALADPQTGVLRRKPEPADSRVNGA